MNTIKSFRRGFTIIEIIIVVAIIGLLAAIAIPNFHRARETAQLTTIRQNLLLIQGAKTQWAISNKKGKKDEPTPAELGKYLKGNALPTPIVDELYLINAVGESPTATAPIKLMDYPVGRPISITLPNN